MERRALALALAVLVLGACSRAKEGALVHIGQPSLPKSDMTSMTFSRLGCYGTCPVYTLTFSRGDAAMYDGRFFVDKIGKYSGEIDFDLVAAWLDSQNVDDYAGEYGNNVTDAEPLTLTITRANRNVVIKSSDTGSLPIRVRGVIAAIDGFANDVRWKPAGAIDSYLGYFLNDNAPGELYALYMIPGHAAADAIGYSHLTPGVKCKADAFANDQSEISLHLAGSRVIAREKSYYRDVGESGLEVPTEVASEPGGLSIGIGAQKRSYRRVTWREYLSEDNAMYRRCHPEK